MDAQTSDKRIVVQTPKTYEELLAIMEEDQRLTMERHLKDKKANAVETK